MTNLTKELSGHGCRLETATDSQVIWHEVAAVAVSSAMLAAYFYRWYRAISSHPLQTMRGVMQQARRSWVAAHLGKGMLPVNTLRDIIKSSQWFASSALLVAVGACGFLASADSVAAQDGFLRFKVMCLIGACSLTFACFMQATRYWSHVSFLINTPDIGGIIVTEDIVYRMVALAANMWTWGQRMQICAALPMLMWFLGPGYLVLATAVAIFVLQHIDYDNVLLTETTPDERGRTRLAMTDSSVSTTAPSDREFLRANESSESTRPERPQEVLEVV